MLIKKLKEIIFNIGNKKIDKLFEKYGYTLYCGRTGQGKTISMVDYANSLVKNKK